MSIWSKLKGYFGGDEGDGPEPRQPSAPWLAADAPGNPFGVPLLDLMANLGMLSTTKDPAQAARAVGWRAGMQREIAVDIDGEARPCALRIPAAANLCEGMLYRPEQMEDKWVFAYRDGRLAAARSWTGETVAVARVEHDGSALVASELIYAESSGLDLFGDPVATFEWLVRVHALRERVPLPVSPEGAALLEAQPLMGFSLYGRQLFCAAVDFELGTPRGRLYSDGDLAAAVAAGDAGRLAEVLAAGAYVDAPCSFGEGGTALHVAIHLHRELIAPLLAAGADASAATDRGSTPLMAAAASGASRSVLAQLAEAGADVIAADQLGFTALHVAAQFGNVESLEALVELGGDLGARTTSDLAVVHIAAGAGQRSAIQWLLDRGEDTTLPSPLGTPVEIARAEGHDEIAALLA